MLIQILPHLSSLLNMVVNLVYDIKWMLLAVCIHIVLGRMVYLFAMTSTLYRRVFYLNAMLRVIV